MLNTLHMPLVHNHHNLLVIASINGSEKIVISLINENLLESWEEDVHTLDIPVKEIRIHALLSKL